MTQTAFCIIVAVIYFIVGAPFIIDNIAVMVEGIKEKKAKRAEAQKTNTEAQQNGRRM